VRNKGADLLLQVNRGVFEAVLEKKRKEKKKGKWRKRSIRENEINREV